MKPECKKYYNKDGSVESEYWYLNGEYHRDGGPAYIDYREDGSIIEKKWYLNGKRHRIDGPALIFYKKDGSVNSKCWFLNDKRIIPEKHLTSTPKTEEEKIELINEFVFIKENNDYIFIKEWLKKDKEFYKKYRMLIK